MTTPHEDFRAAPDRGPEGYELIVDCDTGDGALIGPDGDTLPLERGAYAPLAQLLIKAHVHLGEHR